MKEKFSNKKIGPDKVYLIRETDKLIRKYVAKGFSLTLRQLYYQFVAHDLFPEDRKWTWTGTKWVRDPNGTKNAEPNYKWLGDAISDGRMLGLLSWEAIEDRTRGVETNLRLSGPRRAIEVVRDQYGIDMWANQPKRIEVWIEKEALIGVVEPVCKELDLPYLACRGYVSQSESWRAYRRLQKTHEAGQGTVILHFGDHDPSGIDMTRDNRERLSWFMGVAQYRAMHEAGNGESFEQAMGIEVRRLALTMEQIEEHAPPPNPAKSGDPRFASYLEKFGDESWELDALEPEVITDLIRNEVDQIRDADLWTEKEEQLAEEIETLNNIIEELPE